MNIEGEYISGAQVEECNLKSSRLFSWVVYKDSITGKQRVTIVSTVEAFRIRRAFPNQVTILPVIINE